MSIPSAKPFFSSEDIKEILENIRAVLQSGYLTLGPYTEKFEKMFSKYVGCKHAVAVNSGTSALEIALRCLGVKNGCDVIVPTNTFIASPNSVIFARGKPVFADIDRETLCIDVSDALERITSKTVGVMVVHIAGLVCPQIEQLLKVCEDHDLFLIEDAAHAHGAEFKGRKAGNLGDVGCFSFFPTKVITTAEGGMICTSDHKLLENSKILRNDGVGSEGLHVALGGNGHMSELSAVLGIYQLHRLDYFIEKRNEIASRYREGLKKISGVVPLKTYTHIRHSYYKFPVLVDDDVDSIKLAKILKSNYNVDVGNIYYPPCHLQPIYKELFKYENGAFPVAEEVLKKIICLPMYVQIKPIEVEYVLRSLKDAISSL